jgi:23S rRNA (cytosine1962-C5)-methyltransferase
VNYSLQLEKGHQPVTEDCGRIFNGNGSLLPGITIDKYHDSLLIQYFSSDYCEEIGVICKSSLDLFSKFYPISSIWYKDRTILKHVKSMAEKRESIHYWGSEDRFIQVRHNGCICTVDLVSGQNPGIFMDMREIRNCLTEYYPQVDSLVNLFCYTSLFSVHALANGVSKAVNVDTSKQVLLRSQENYRNNNLVVDSRDFIHEDSGRYLKRMYKRKETCDLVFYDPPTFSRNKKFHYSVKSDYRNHLDLISTISNRYVLTAINSYSVSKDEYLSYHPRSWEMLFFKNEARDFLNPHDPYLKCALWQVNN